MDTLANIPSPILHSTPRKSSISNFIQNLDFENEYEESQNKLAENEKYISLLQNKLLEMKEEIDVIQKKYSDLKQRVRNKISSNENIIYFDYNKGLSEEQLGKFITQANGKAGRFIRKILKNLYSSQFLQNCSLISKTGKTNISKELLYSLEIYCRKAFPQLTTKTFLATCVQLFKDERIKCKKVNKL